MWIVCQPPYASDKEPPFCSNDNFAAVLQGECPCSADICELAATS